MSCNLTPTTYHLTASSSFLLLPSCFLLPSTYGHLLLVALPDFSCIQGTFEADEGCQTEILGFLAVLSVFELGDTEGNRGEGRRASLAGAVGGNGLQFYAGAVSGAVGGAVGDRSV
ncbi:MAG: hypothetical protein MUE44_31960 [Oscillatoriaceae cyanobacterium Prado104]|nr:hypothetical protein [Oscillatoriaceae cyanobacterium Prado104]